MEIGQYLKRGLEHQGIFRVFRQKVYGPVYGPVSSKLKHVFARYLTRATTLYVSDSEYIKTFVAAPYAKFHYLWDRPKF